MSEPPEYVTFLQEHFYTLSRYLTPEDFLDKLVSQKVLNLDDKEVITNHCINQNRRQRTNKLLEILMTRGEHGYERFMEILEYQYPHVFIKVTNKEPRTPPDDYQPRSRTSDRLRILDNLPNLAQYIKEQYMQNQDLDAQLTVLQQLLEFSKEENLALEQEINTLKNIRKENENLRLKIENQDNNLSEIKDKLIKEMEKSQQLKEEKEQYRDRWQSLKLSNDDLRRKYEELVNQRARGPVASGVADSSLQSNQGSEVSVAERRHQHLVEQRNILQEELDTYRDQCEDISSRLQTALERERQLELLNEMQIKEMNKRQKEIRVLEKQHNEQLVKINTYYEMIQKKDQELFDLNNQRMQDQKKFTDLQQEKFNIFKQNHELEQSKKEIETELNKLKARLSGSSQGSEQASGSDEELVGDERRENLKKYGRYNRDKGSHQIGLTGPDFDSAASQCLACETSHVEENTSRGKFNTLPNMNDTPMEIFDREVMYFRYSRKEPNHKRLEQSESMAVGHGSVRVPSAECLPFFPQNDHFFTEDLNDTLNPDDCASNSTSSTVYRPRAGQGAGDQAWANRTDVIGRGVDSMPRHLDDVGNDKDNDDQEKCVSLSEHCISPFEVYKVLLPKPCIKITRPGRLNNELRTVTLKYPVLNDKIKLYGGNHTGIFISEVFKHVDLSPGEEIKQIVYILEPEKQVEVPLQGCTLEEVHKLLSDTFINKRKYREVKLKVRKCAQEFESVKRWLVEKNNTGDYLFIRCSVPLDSKKEEETSLRPGDVFLVTNSCHGPKQWAGYRVNRKTDIVERSQLVIIPNFQQAHLRRMPSEEERGPRHHGFRIRGNTYDRVLPMKASFKLGIHVVGPSKVVDSIIDFISRKMADKFSVHDPDGDASCGSDRCSDMMSVHHVKKGKFDRNCIQRIVVLVNISAVVPPEVYRNIFGEVVEELNEDVVRQCAALRQKLVDIGQNFEEVCIPEVSSQEAFQKRFETCVSVAQDRIFWLSGSEVERHVSERYQSMLGNTCDLSEIMSQLQRAQSVDKNSSNV